MNLRQLSLSLDKTSCQSPSRKSLKKILRSIPLANVLKKTENIKLIQLSLGHDKNCYESSPVRSSTKFCDLFYSAMFKKAGKYESSPAELEPR